MRKFFIALVFSALATAPIAAHADSVVNITLTDGTSLAVVGSGTITLDAAPNPGNPLQTYTISGAPGQVLKSLSVTILGDTLSTLDPTDLTLGADAQFSNASLVSVDFFALDSTSTVFFSSDGLNYTFSDANTEAASTGTISVTPAGVGVVPEPSTLALFGSGLVSVAGLARRRFSR